MRPQFSPAQKIVSAATAGRYLAAAYDALKAVDPGIAVIGLGLSPRGNDNPTAPANVSTSPVRFLEALGSWYRASGRRAPLMDGLSFHPYPNRATDPLERGYDWPNAGFANLARIKQALWDAFHGTRQRTTRNGLKLYLDEVGWQVDTSRRDGYTGVENVPVTTEAKQAVIYGELVSEALCDDDIAEVNIFGFYDNSVRNTGFQAGLNRVDGSPRRSAAAVAQAIFDSSLGMRGLQTPWRPATAVVGARAPTDDRESHDNRRDRRRRGRRRDRLPPPGVAHACRRPQSRPCPPPVQPWMCRWQDDAATAGCAEVRPHAGWPPDDSGRTRHGRGQQGPHDGLLADTG